MSNMFRIPAISSKCILGGGLALAMLVAFGAHAASQEKVLYSFTGGSDGDQPLAGLIADSAGNLYGTTADGGANGGGIVFKVTPKGKETVLYSFCSAANCTDGASPQAGLIADGAANLYGTTAYGGANDGGTVFKLTPRGKEAVLYSLCSAANCTDGAHPRAGLTADSAGNLYGTTPEGGIGNCSYSCGTVFEVTPKGKETVLYSFCSAGYCTDGGGPHAGLISDAAGNLYGTTVYGGANGLGYGIVFKLTPKGKETVLFSFCPADDCTGGQNPFARLIADGAGNLYGTTVDGGDSDSGTVFKLTPKGKETVLHTFCSGIGCTDGYKPSAGVIADGAGNLYGTTDGGGVNGSGIVFKVTRKGKETVLYSFCSSGNCTDGAHPSADLIADSAGNLYGTTSGGGIGNCAGGCGTVFKIKQ